MEFPSKIWGPCPELALFSGGENMRYWGEKMSCYNMYASISLLWLKAVMYSPHYNIHAK